MKEKQWELNMKEFLKQANWGHEDFPIIARFFGTNIWKVSEKMLTPITDKKYKV